MQTYDRHSIEQWLREGHRTCPRTQLPLSQPVVLIPNFSLRSLFENWCAAHHVDPHKQPSRASAPHSQPGDAPGTPPTHCNSHPTHSTHRGSKNGTTAQGAGAWGGAGAGAWAERETGSGTGPGTPGEGHGGEGGAAGAVDAAELAAALTRRLNDLAIEERRQAAAEIRQMAKRSDGNRAAIAAAGAIPSLVRSALNVELTSNHESLKFLIPNHDSVDCMP